MTSAAATPAEEQTLDRRALRVITWNVARRSSCLVEQAAALASREPDVVALQEVTDTTLPLWRAVLERIGLPHVRASLETADPSRVPASRRRTGVLVGSGGALRDPPATLPVPWAETAVAAVAATALGPVEIHCLHVPNAANGQVKTDTLRAVREGWRRTTGGARGVRRPQHPRRELESGEVVSFARDSRGRLRPERGSDWRRRRARGRPRSAGNSATRTPIAHSTATHPASRAGRGSESQVMPGAGASTTCSPRRSWSRLPAPTTMPGATRARRPARRWRPTWSRTRRSHNRPSRGPVRPSERGACSTALPAGGLRCSERGSCPWPP